MSPAERLIGRLARFALNGAAFCIFFVGAIFKVDQMFLMALALALLPGAVWLVGRALSGGIVCERSLPRFSAVGEAVSVTLMVTNAARLARPALRVSETLPRRIHFVGDAATLILNLRPGETRQVTYQIEAERRGRYALTTVRVDTRDPLGFFGFTQRCAVRSDFNIYPRPLPLRRVFWEESAATAGYGQEGARRRGAGIEFHGVREYQPGDELRHVHWRTTARRGVLSVAEYTQETSLSSVVALDLCRAAYAELGDGAATALEIAVTLAASICGYLAQRGSPVRLLTPDDYEDPEPPGSGSAMAMRILNRLVGVEAQSEMTLADLLQGAPVTAGSGRTLICITPVSPDPVLSQFLAGEAAAGRSVFGLQISGGAFRGQPPASASPGIPWKIISSGDDLVRVMEG